MGIAKAGFFPDSRRADDSFFAMVRVSKGELLTLVSALQDTNQRICV